MSNKPKYTGCRKRKPSERLFLCVYYFTLPLFQNPPILIPRWGNDFDFIFRIQVVSIPFHISIRIILGQRQSGCFLRCNPSGGGGFQQKVCPLGQRFPILCFNQGDKLLLTKGVHRLVFPFVVGTLAPFPQNLLRPFGVTAHNPQKAIVQAVKGSGILC